MPSTSKKQAHLMAAVAHNPAFAKKVGIPQSVGKEFNKADKGKTFKGGGMAKKEMHSEKGEMKKDLAQDKKMIKKAFGMHDKQLHEKKHTDLSKLKSGGSVKPSSMRKDVEKGSNKLTKFGESAVQKRGHTKGKEVKMCGGGMAMKGKKK